MSQSEVKIHIPRELISDTVRAEIVRQIGSGEEMVEAVVRGAMEAPAERYGRKTVFQKSVEDMIVGEAKKVFGEWLEENRDGIRDALIKYLNGNKQRRLAELAEGLATNLTEHSVKVFVDLRRWEEE